MPFVVVVVGVLIAVAAWNNSFGALATELESDLPAYFRWGAAIALILALGFIPGMKTPSRYLLALVAVVLLLTNYQQIFTGLQSFALSGGPSSGDGSATPVASYVEQNAPAASAAIASTAEGSGSGSGSPSGVMTAAAALAANPLNPNAYVGLAAGFGGLA